MCDEGNYNICITYESLSENNEMLSINIFDYKYLGFDLVTISHFII